MKMRCFYILVLLLLSLQMRAQENLPFGERREIVSPEIHANNTVTFRLMAPNANNVTVTSFTG